MTSERLGRIRIRASAAWKTFCEWLQRLENRITGPLNMANNHRVYILCLALLGAYWMLATTGHGYGIGGWRATFYLCIAAVETAAAWSIRESWNYHPAYKLEKALTVAAFLWLSTSVFLRVTPGNQQIAWGWVGLFVFSRVAAFEYIIYRNRVQARKFVRTQRGLLEIASAQDADANADWLAAQIRHGLVGPAEREELLEALRQPPIDAWTAQLRKQMRDKRDLRSGGASESGSAGAG